MAENALFMRLNRYGLLEKMERYQFELIRSSQGEFKNLTTKRKNIIKKLK